MIADDHVYSQLIGECHLVYGLDTTVKGNHQRGALLMSPAHAGLRDTVSLLVPVRYVVFELIMVPVQKAIDQRDCRSAVHVVIAIDKYLFLPGDGLSKACDRLIHVLHQEGVVQLIQ